jgi:SAM-dependent methyltransferase
MTPLSTLCWVATLSRSVRQKAHFETIHDEYEAHYYDPWSLRYRDEFILPFIWEKQGLNALRVAELACGSGHNSLALRNRFPEMKVTGFDISPSACDSYESRLGTPAVQVDLTKPFDFEAVYDLAFVVGGLHHCVADLDQTLANVARMLKPGGSFVMLEPNALFFLEGLRSLWYRLDSSFDAATEHALFHDDLLASASEYFTCTDTRYFGGPGYFVILNSMILRIPPKVKPYLSPPLIEVERYWNRIPGRRFHNVFLARWRRNETKATNPIQRIA